MTVLVCGSRYWTDASAIRRRLEALPPGSVIIAGGAPGADVIAAREARDIGFSAREIVADWGGYGKAAGPMRNRMMLDQNPDLVIAFHEDLAASKGTNDCIAQARKRGIPVEIIASVVD